MSELSSAIRSVCEEKGLNYESVLETIEFSLAAAYRKDFGHKNQNIKVDFDPETSKTKIKDVKTVVEDLQESEEDPEEDEKKNKKKNEDQVEDQDKNKEEEEEESKERKFNPKTDIQLSEAKDIKKDAKVGDEITIELETPEGYGRMAAQTAKQVIIQKLREAERENIYTEFKEKEKEVVNGVVQRREGRNVLVDLGRAVGCLPPEEQVYGERYNSGERIKVFIKEVSMESRGPRIILSRSSSEIVKALFYLEIPELNNGTIEIRDVARSAGSRSKVAVWTEVENIDPIGSCVGQKGSRIQTIINELGGEKIDIIEYSEEMEKYIANSLSPAKVINVETNEKNKTAEVKVSPDQFSLAIGKKGENIRLASELIGWKINIKEDKESSEEEPKEVSSEEILEENKEEAEDGSEKENKSSQETENSEEKPKEVSSEEILEENKEEAEDDSEKKDNSSQETENSEEKPKEKKKNK